MVARSEILAGAALFASATSASRCIKYSLSGGYFEPCAQAAETARLTSTALSACINFFMFGIAPSFFVKLRPTCITGQRRIRIRSVLSQGTEAIKLLRGIAMSDHGTGRRENPWTMGIIRDPDDAMIA